MHKESAKVYKVITHNSERFKGLQGYLFMERSERDIDRIIEMAWEDRTSFDAIKSPIWSFRKRGDTSDAA